GEGCSTIDMDVRYLRAVTGGRLVGRARIVHSGKRIFFAEASVHCGEALVALAQATFRRFRIGEAG
ncbi:MAG TPA: PaaI family thioesterase, partial [Bacillota bacterium]